MSFREELSRTIQLLRREIQDTISTRLHEPSLGHILDDYSLQVDSFTGDVSGTPLMFKRGEWLCSKYLTMPEDFFTVTPNAGSSGDPKGNPSDPDSMGTAHPVEGYHPHGWPVRSGEHAGHFSPFLGDHEHPDTEGAHWHHVQTPEWLKPLRPGDLVLVTFVRSGTLPIVTDVVVSSDELERQTWW